MPDDIAAAEVAEPEVDKGEGFSEGFADKPVEKADAKVEDKTKLAAEGKPDAGKPAAKVDAAAAKPAAKVEEKPVQTAEEKLAARAEAKDTAAAAAKKAALVAEDKPVIVEKAVEKKAEGKKPLLDLADLADLSPEQLGGMKVKVVDDDGKETEQTLSELGKTFPELIGTATQIARHMTKAMGDRVNAALEQILGGVVTKDELGALRADLGHAQFWEGVTSGVATKAGYIQGHPDARKIVASPEFEEWGAKQSKVIQAMLDSDDPEDGIAVLDAYKESLAKAAKTGVTAKATDDKKKRDGLHADTVRTRGVETEGAEDKAKGSFSEGFNS